MIKHCPFTYLFFIMMVVIKHQRYNNYINSSVSTNYINIINIYMQVKTHFLEGSILQLIHQIYCKYCCNFNLIGGVTVSVLASSDVDRGFIGGVTFGVLA